jgi:hypothetical protein
MTLHANTLAYGDKVDAPPAFDKLWLSGGGGGVH